jgi:hypothetical protein
VYQILQAHDGQIRVETAEGEGTEFVVELPRAQRASAAPRVPAFPDSEVATLRTVGKG